MAEPMPTWARHLVAQHREERRPVGAGAHSCGQHGVDGQRRQHDGRPSRVASGSLAQVAGPARRARCRGTPPAAKPIASSRRASVSTAGARPATTCGSDSDQHRADATTATTCSAPCVGAAVGQPGQQRVGERARRRDRRGVATAGQGDPDELAEGDEGGERERDPGIDETVRRRCHHDGSHREQQRRQRRATRSPLVAGVVQPTAHVRSRGPLRDQRARVGSSWSKGRRRPGRTARSRPRRRPNTGVASGASRAPRWR